MGLERTLSNVHFFHFFHLFYRLLRIFTFRLHVQGRRRRRRRTVPTSHTTTRSIMYVFFSYCLFFSFTNGFLLDNIYRDYDTQPPSQDSYHETPWPLPLSTRPLYFHRQYINTSGTTTMTNDPHHTHSHPPSGTATISNHGHHHCQRIHPQ